MSKFKNGVFQIIETGELIQFHQGILLCKQCFAYKTVSNAKERESRGVKLVSLREEKFHISPTEIPDAWLTKSFEGLISIYSISL